MGFVWHRMLHFTCLKKKPQREWTWWPWTDHYGTPKGGREETDTFRAAKTPCWACPVALCWYQTLKLNSMGLVFCRSPPAPQEHNVGHWGDLQQQYSTKEEEHSSLCSKFSKFLICVTNPYPEITSLPEISCGSNTWLMTINWKDPEEFYWRHDTSQIPLLNLWLWKWQPSGSHQLLRSETFPQQPA